MGNLISLIIILLVTGVLNRKYILWKRKRFKQKLEARYEYTLNYYKEKYEENPTEENRELYEKADAYYAINAVNSYISFLKENDNLKICEKCKCPMPKEYAECEVCGHRHVFDSYCVDYTDEDYKNALRRIVNEDSTSTPLRNNSGRYFINHDHTQEHKRKKHAKVKCPECGATSNVIDQRRGVQVRKCRNGHTFSYLYGSGEYSSSKQPKFA